MMASSLGEGHIWWVVSLGLMDRGREPLSSHWATGLWVRGPVATQSQREPSPAPAQPSASPAQRQASASPGQRQRHRFTFYQPKKYTPLNGFPQRFGTCSPRISVSDQTGGVYFFYRVLPAKEYTPQISDFKSNSGVYFFIVFYQQKNIHRRFPAQVELRCIFFLSCFTSKVNIHRRFPSQPQAAVYIFYR